MKIRKLLPPDHILIDFATMCRSILFLILGKTDGYNKQA